MKQDQNEIGVWTRPDQTRWISIAISIRILIYHSRPGVHGDGGVRTCGGTQARQRFGSCFCNALMCRGLGVGAAGGAANHYFLVEGNMAEAFQQSGLNRVCSFFARPSVHWPIAARVACCGDNAACPGGCLWPRRLDSEVDGGMGQV